MNYADHAAESGLEIPAEPVLFMKATSCLAGPNDAVQLPQGSVKTDWEVELGVVIGTRARYVSEHAALGHVAGYCIVNDISEREYQLERGGTWDKGKSCDTFGPVGPWLVTTDEVPNPQALGLWLDVTRSRPGAQAAELPACRRHDAPRHRRARRAVPDRPRMGCLAGAWLTRLDLPRLQRPGHPRWQH